jgi:hypothetical protein
MATNIPNSAKPMPGAILSNPTLPPAIVAANFELACHARQEQTISKVNVEPRRQIIATLGDDMNDALLALQFAGAAQQQGACQGIAGPHRYE